MCITQSPGESYCGQVPGCESSFDNSNREKFRREGLELVRNGCLAENDVDDENSDDENRDAHEIIRVLQEENDDDDVVDETADSDSDLVERYGKKSGIFEKRLGRSQGNPKLKFCGNYVVDSVVLCGHHFEIAADALFPDYISVAEWGYVSMLRNLLNIKLNVLRVWINDVTEVSYLRTWKTNQFLWKRIILLPKKQKLYQEHGSG
ncbi:hypothetical protein FQA39_LY13992 [Lamprigera yunnana]|nr:hypothetical protein FQA39_LY13992 [Lamprigera yunnana]